MTRIREIPISDFNEVAGGLLKLSKEIEKLQRRLYDEQQQRLQTKQTIEELLTRLRQKNAYPPPRQGKTAGAGANLVTTVKIQQKLS